jgi:hypothetical protein
MNPIPGYDSESSGPAGNKSVERVKDESAVMTEEEGLAYKESLQVHQVSSEKETPEIKSTTDLVVSLESGLTIFFAVLILSGAAFYIGYQKGSADILLNLSVRLNKEEVTAKGSTDNLKPVEKIFETRKVKAVLPASAYVLRLLSYEKNGPGLTRAKKDADFARIQKAVYREKMEVYILQNEAAYSVCLGPAGSRHDPRLEKLRKIFNKLSGPPSSRGDKPYAGSFVEKVDKLGRVLQ